MKNDTLCKLKRAIFLLSLLAVCQPVTKGEPSSGKITIVIVSGKDFFKWNNFRMGDHFFGSLYIYFNVYTHHLRTIMK